MGVALLHENRLIGITRLTRVFRCCFTKVPKILNLDVMFIVRATKFHIHIKHVSHLCILESKGFWTKDNTFREKVHSNEPQFNVMFTK